jgi:hypothetical protein
MHISDKKYFQNMYVYHWGSHYADNFKFYSNWLLPLTRYHNVVRVVFIAGETNLVIVFCVMLPVVSYGTI